MSFHRNAKLGLGGRFALVCAIEGGLSIRAAAGRFNVSPATAHRWWCRWREASEESQRTLVCLFDRSSKPHRSPRELAGELQERICACRRETGWGPRLVAAATGFAHSTVWKVLKRAGISRPPRPTKEPANRYEWPCPGDLLHMDTSRYARFLRPGHKVTGDRSHRQRGWMKPETRVGYDYAHAIVDDQPKDAEALALLGLSYQQRGRETGDPTFYKLAGNALQRAADAGGPQPLIAQGRASLANTRHRFGDGLRLARQAIRLAPDNGSAYGALGDALLNLGRYPEAFKAYDRMAVFAPGIASYTRVANARELLGRPVAAAEADTLALGTGSTVPEHVAWTTVQLGNVDFNTGRLDATAKVYRRALERLPGYVHAEAGLARVEASEGRYGQAIVRLRHVVDVLPIPAYVILLGDILHASDHETQARRQYALVAAIERLFAANGVRTELQTAVFDLDHGRNIEHALARARSAYSSAPGIYAEDALAWGLFRAGRCEQARAHSAHALRLGTRDALLIFHRAMIERCLGSESGRAWFQRALATNPHFSFLWAPVAREAIATAP